MADGTTDCVGGPSHLLMGAVLCIDSILGNTVTAQNGSGIKWKALLTQRVAVPAILSELSPPPSIGATKKRL